MDLIKTKFMKKVTVGNLFLEKNVFLKVPKNRQIIHIFFINEKYIEQKNLKNYS